MSETILVQPNEKILDGVLDEFAQLAKIPRPSKHEGQVSNYLKKFFEQRGLQVVQDKLKNIVAEIPASPDEKNSPLTILQAHMDMVCVAENGYAFNPLKDSIRLIRGEKFLEARGTSLGADDGIGIAEILYLVENRDAFKHGPIRVIFTVDEEEGMSGASNLDEKFLSDAAFMINCDSENFGEVVVGCAGSVHVTMRRELHYVRPDTKLSTNVEVKIGGLRGGHSGIEIACGRINALKIAVQILRQVTRNGKIRLASLNGGHAFNVIPDSAEFVFTTDLSKSDVEKICATTEENLKRIYPTEPNVKIEAKFIPRPEKVLHAKDFECLTNLVALIHSGVFLMSPTESASVFASSNLGVIHMDDEFVTLKIFPRANTDDLVAEFMDSFGQAARLCQFDTKFSTAVPAWRFNPDSRLKKFAEEIFTAQNGHAPEFNTVHVGLEPSFFSKKNPALDIISIGTTNENIHSPNERLHLDTVAPHVKFIVGLLKRIASCD